MTGAGKANPIRWLPISTLLFANAVFMTDNAMVAYFALPSFVLEATGSALSMPDKFSAPWPSRTSRMLPELCTINLVPLPYSLSSTNSFRCRVVSRDRTLTGREFANAVLFLQIGRKREPTSGLEPLT